MTKDEAIELIDKNKNELINPVEMLRWTWLRVIILNITEEQWNTALTKAVDSTLSK